MTQEFLNSCIKNKKLINLIKSYKKLAIIIIIIINILFLWIFMSFKSTY
jgi:hypothetical protein